jgi:hypothetical protein
LYFQYLYGIHKIFKSKPALFIQTLHPNFESLRDLIKESPRNIHPLRALISQLIKSRRAKIQIIQSTSSTAIHNSNVHAYIPVRASPVSRRSNTSITIWIHVRISSRGRRVYSNRISKTAKLRRPRGYRRAAKRLHRPGLGTWMLFHRIQARVNNMSYSLKKSLPCFLATANLDYNQQSALDKERGH